MARFRLQQARERRGITLHRAATETRLGEKLIEQLETNQPTGLHPEYEAGVRATYRRYLGLSNAKTAKQHSAARPRPKIRHPSLRLHKTVVTATLLRRSAVGLVLFLAVGYGFWQLLSLASAPRLNISQPAKNEIVHVSSIDIEGRTNSGAEVFINNEPVLIEPDGHFKETISLRRGVNDIDIVAINALAKRSSVQRTIVFQP